MDQLNELDLVSSEIVGNFFTVVLFNFIINDSNTSTKWLVYLSQDLVGWVQDSSGDLDGSGNVGAHDSFDSLRVWGSNGASVAMSVDGGWVNRVRIDLDKSLIVVKICLGFGKLVGFLHIIFESDVTKIFLVEKFVNLF
jgi:hypothetical protein